MRLATRTARAWLSPQQAMPWADICTVAGTQGALDVAPLSGSGQHDGPLFKHCPFCLNHGRHFALPTPAHDLLPPAAACNEGIPSAVATPAPCFIRVAAQPRASPANSLYNIMPPNAKLALVQSLNNWTNTAELQLIDAKTRVSQVRNELKTGGYGLLNLRSSYAWKQARFDVGIENVFDRLYSHPLGGA